MRPPVRSIIIDDEQPAINALIYQLNKYSNIYIMASFTDVFSAFSWLPNNTIDLVFLDIEMNKMSGIVVAKKLSSLCPQAEIIFVTAHENYAVQAFELEAFDYIMKPVSAKRLSKAINRYLDKGGKPSGQPIPLQCFGQFMLKDSEDIKWRTSKAKELFAFLVHNRGGYVQKDTILQSLWPDLDRDKASNLLYTNLHNLRKMLADHGHNDVIVYSNGTYKISSDKLAVDVDEFLNVWKQIDSGSKISTHAIEAAINHCHGDYLAMEGYEWAKETQVHLENILISLLNILTDMLEKTAHHEKHERYLLKWLNIQPYSRQVFSKLFHLYAAKVDVTSFVKTYKTMTIRLRTELGVEPDSAIIKIYNDLYNGAFLNSTSKRGTP